MQWADASLLDFIEYLLDWSRQSPLFVVTAARPELARAAADLGRGQAQLHLDLPRAALPQAMRDLLEGLVPGLPDSAPRPDPGPGRGRAPVRDGDGAHAARPRPPRPRGQRLPADRAGRGAGGARDAARADRRPPGRPRATTSGGSCRTARCWARPSPGGRWRRSRVRPNGARAGPAGARAQGGASIQADPRSPEHGQYGFLQDLMRRVAYETLAMRDRRDRHLAAAAYMEGTFPDDDETVEVLASHYLDAYNTAPDATDADGIRARARDAHRPRRLSAPPRWARPPRRSATTPRPPTSRTTPLERAGLLDRAGRDGAAPATQDVAAELSSRRGRCTRRRASRTRGPRHVASGRGSIRLRAASGGDRAHGAGLRGAFGRASPARTSPCWRRGWPAPSTSRAK